MDSSDQTAATLPQPPAAAPIGEPAAVELGFRVDLDSFSGPLDLLLFLVRRAEVDITTVAISQIADQFLATVAAWQDMDLDLAGDFILMAASLLELKARTIAPKPQDEDDKDDESEDLLEFGSDLVRQLLVFRRFKDAVDLLDDLERRRSLSRYRRFDERIPEPTDDGEGIDLDNADPYRLYREWERIERLVAGHRDRTIAIDDIPIDDRIRQIAATMQEAREGQLAWFLTRCPNRIHQAGTVQAVLEAVRQLILEAIQHEQFGPVYLRYRDPAENRREVEQRAQALTLFDPEAEKGKTRRRPPLVTFRTSEPSHPVQESLDLGEDDSRTEPEEDRFLRELNDQLGLDALLDRMRCFDGLMRGFLNERGIILTPDPPAQSAPQDGTGHAPPPSPCPSSEPSAQAPSAGHSAGQGEG